MRPGRKYRHQENAKAFYTKKFHGPILPTAREDMTGTVKVLIMVEQEQALSIRATVVQIYYSKIEPR